jgi:hypothetical protein
MSPPPPSQLVETEPGQLLQELELRQDEVLVELENLDNRLREVLQSLGVTVDEECDETLF